MGTLEKAIHIAVQAHHGQKDKAGAPYILHPLRVMLRVDSEAEMIVGVLHDVVEDSHWTLEDLRREGFSEEIVQAIDCLTHKEEDSYERFIEKVKDHRLARKVKLADLEDNLDITRIRELTERDWRRVKKYQQAWLKLKEDLEGFHRLTSKR